MANLRTGFSQGPEPQRMRVKLFGIGSAGCNMIEGAPYPKVAFSSSSADIARSHADRKILVSQDRLIGLSDSSPDMLKQIQEVVGHELFDMFNNTEIAFLMCGLGGLSGSYGAKMLCSVAKAKGTTSIVLATTPFSAESHRRREFAGSAMSSLLTNSTLCIAFDNDMLSSLAPQLPMSRAFGLLNRIMLRPVIELCSTMARDDVPIMRQALGDSTYGRFGLGLARGDDRVEHVVREALSSPWFDFDTGEARAAIVTYSSSDPWDKERDNILSALESRLPSAHILWGSFADPSLGEAIRLSLVLCTKKNYEIKI